MTVTWDEVVAVVDLAAPAVPPPPSAPRKAGTMTVTAARPQAAARPAPPGRRLAGTSQQPAAVTPPPAPRTRRVPLTPMRQQAAKSMRRLAEGIQRDHPELAVHDHVRDAARTLEAGNEEASQRHLRAAMFSLSPQSLMRNGVHDDIGHISARQAVHGVHRHLLLVKDIADVAAKNQAAIRRDSYGDYESGPSLPRADPNAGYGPGALAQKPTARQPAGNQALNAPARTNSGGSDPAVADPVGPQPKGSKQFARTWDELLGVLDLSAETGRLAVTPAPYGKPGGPGLYGVHGLKHSDYVEQIVQALMRKGMDKGKATAIARGSIRKWMAKSKHPEVRAAAGLAEGQEIAAQARAHAHATTWDELATVIDLAFIANPTPAQWAVIDAREGRVWKPDKAKVGAVVAHQDGTVTGNAGKVQVGTLSHEGSKWVAHHGDGTVSKHAVKATALKSMAAHHNKAATAPPAPARAAVLPPSPAAPAVPPGAAPPAASKPPTKITAAGLVVHKDGSVAHKATGAQVGTLTHENGKYVVHHADGTTTKHATKQAAIQAIAAHHNKAGAAQQPAALKPAAEPAANPAAAPKPSPEPAPTAKAAGAQAEAPLSDEDKHRLTGLWSTSYRYSNTAFGTGQLGKDFAGELHRTLSTNKPPAVCQAGCQDAHKFLAMVDHDATVQHSEMQRGLSLSTEDAKRMFQPGKTMDMPAASWTTKKSVATEFTKAPNKDPGKMKVILHTAPPAKGLDISSMSNFPSEHEVVTGGRYNVGKVTTTGGVMHVYVTQGDFSAN